MIDQLASLDGVLRSIFDRLNALEAQSTPPAGEQLSPSYLSVDQYGNVSAPFLQLLRPPPQTVKLQWGHFVNFANIPANVTAYAISATTAQLGFSNQTFAGTLFPWPLSTWSGFQLVTAGYTATPTGGPNSGLQTTLNNGATAQSIDAYWIALGN
jgi:hypothetical protein